MAQLPVATPEPPGAEPATATGGRGFVVQRHRASRLHYDLRPEIDGVLVSWAVPKGPTLDPGVRRSAFRVGDHPLDYATNGELAELDSYVDFEGIIPSGDFGSAGRWSVFGRVLPGTNPDKVLFPPRTDEGPVTKRDLLRYAAQIAPTLLPYLTRRL